VTSIQNYYPFGMDQPNRTWNANGKYRYGFNGKEKDDNGEWGSAVYDYGFRIYNPSIGKFLSVDPLTKSYPWYTPYQFAGNKPIVSIDLDGLEELDYRILERIKTNVTEVNVNTDLAPSSFMGEKTRVVGGRKWNARWSFAEMNKIDPTFWSDANKAKILNGELPSVDPHYLNRIGKGLTEAEFASLAEAAPLNSVIRHHHMNHGRFAVALSENIHTGAGNTKFWHKVDFKNPVRGLVKNGLRIFELAGIAISLHAIINGNYAEASPLPAPDFDLDQVSYGLLQQGIMTNDFQRTSMGVNMLDDISVEYWTADDMMNFLNGGKVNATEGGQRVDNDTARKYPYMNVLYQGGSIGVVEIPD
ncbi:RHS repeat-associated core domain-containing protein, partial [Chryseosolibacter indicus]